MFFKEFIFSKTALNTDFGATLFVKMKENGLNPRIGTTKKNDDLDEMDLSAKEIYREGKRVLFLSSRSPSKFENCRPSAYYQLPILSGCPGLCEYCYLMTRTGEKSAVKLNCNLEKVYKMIDNYIKEASPQKISFELSASSDPIPFEEPTGIVTEIINHFGELENTKLRICTKFDPPESILEAHHNGKCDFRFSLNTPYVIDNYEHNVPSLDRRLVAAKKIADAGYNLGIMIAPIFLYDNWQKDYTELLDKIEAFLGDNIVSFEAVTHRYTNKARETIIKIFPDTVLDMDDDKRKFKMGQFGYGKFVYPKDDMELVKAFFKIEIEKRFPNSKLLYVV